MFLIYGLESESSYEAFYADKNNVGEVAVVNASFFNIFDRDNIF